MALLLISLHIFLILDLSALLRLQQTASGGLPFQNSASNIAPSSITSLTSSTSALSATRTSDEARADSLNVLRLKAREHEMKLEMLKRMES